MANKELEQIFKNWNNSENSIFDLAKCAKAEGVRSLEMATFYRETGSFLEKLLMYWLKWRDPEFVSKNLGLQKLFEEVESVTKDNDKITPLSNWLSGEGDDDKHRVRMIRNWYSHGRSEGEWEKYLKSAKSDKIVKVDEVCGFLRKVLYLVVEDACEEVYKDEAGETGWSKVPVSDNLDEDVTVNSFRKILCEHVMATGSSVIPLIGSAASRLSGVIPPEDNLSYLQYVIYRCVASPDWQASAAKDEERSGRLSEPVGRFVRWDIANHGFPSFPTNRQLSVSREWRDSIALRLSKHQSLNSWVKTAEEVSSAKEADGFRAYSEGRFVAASIKGEDKGLARDLAVRIGAGTTDHKRATTKQHFNAIKKRLAEVEVLYPLVSHSEEEVIAREAVGAGSNWISAQVFLSRLAESEPMSLRGTTPLRLTAPDSEVIDAFNLFRTRGKKPNLTHQMLAYLTRPLRVRTVLTTVSDGLQVRALEEIGQPFICHYPNAENQVASAALVRTQDSVVPLHGAASTSKGDLFSVQGIPQDEELQSFSNYFFDSRLGGSRESSRTLLVIGYQANDERVIGFLRHLMGKILAARVSDGESEAGKAAGRYDDLLESLFGEGRLVLPTLVSELKNAGNSVQKFHAEHSHDYLEPFLKAINELRIHLYEWNFGALDKTRFEKLQLCRKKLDIEKIRIQLEKIVTNNKKAEKTKITLDAEELLRKLTELDALLSQSLGEREIVTESVKEISKGLDNHLEDCKEIHKDWIIANTRIFWILDRTNRQYHCRAGFDGTEHFAERLRDRLLPGKDPELEKAVFDSVVRFCTPRRPDLLLYEMYQDLTCSLPPGGLQYRFTFNVPPQPVSVEDQTRIIAAQSVSADDFQDTLLGAISDKKTSESFGCTRRTSFSIYRRCIPDQAPMIIVFGGRGVSSLIPDVYWALQGRQLHTHESIGRSHEDLRNWQCIWLELADYSDASAVWLDFFDTVSQRMGIYGNEHVHLSPDTGFDNVHRLDILRQYFRLDDERWVLFVHGRSVPGVNSGWQDNNSGSLFEGAWNDESYYAELHRLMGYLTQIGVTIVYLPQAARYENRVAERLGVKSEDIVATASPDPKIKELLKDLQLPEEVGSVEDYTNGEKLDPGEPCLLHWNDLHNEDSKSVFERVKGFLCPEEAEFKKFEDYWEKQTHLSDSIRKKCLEFDDTPHRVRFLHSISLFRHSRHITALASEAAIRCIWEFKSEWGKDNDAMRAALANRWLEELRKTNLLRVKYGGFWWIHWEYRLRIRHMLDNDYKEIHEKGQEPKFLLSEEGTVKRNGVALKSSSFGKRSMKQRTATTHHWISVWYFKAFQASRNLHPAKECLYHCLQTLLSAESSSHPEVDGEMVRDFKHQVEYLALAQIHKALRVCRPSIKFWNKGMDIHDSFEKLIETVNAKKVSADLLPLRDKVSNEIRAILRAIEDQTGKAHYPPSSDLLEGHRSVELAGESYSEQSSAQKPDGAQVSGGTPNDSGSTSEETKSPKTRAARKVKDNLGKRTYLKSVISHREILRAINPAMTAGKVLDESLDKEYSEKLSVKGEAKFWKGYIEQWFQEQTRSENEIVELIGHLGGLAYTNTKRTKVWEDVISIKIKKPDHVNWVATRESWANICALCSSVIRLARFLSADQLEVYTREQVTMRGIYAIALSHLGRHTEAHRRLDEATAYLASSRLSLEDAEWGVLRLRRAECFIWQGWPALGGVELGDTDNDEGRLDQGEMLAPIYEAFETDRRLSALNQAWSELNRAEEFFSDSNRSDWWWGRLAVLQLRVVAGIAAIAVEQPPEQKNDMICASLPFRTRIKPSTVVYRILRRSLLLNPNDSMRVARLSLLVCRLREPMAGHVAEPFSNVFSDIKPSWKRLKEYALHELGSRSGSAQDTDEKVIAAAVRAAKEALKKIR